MIFGLMTPVHAEVVQTTDGRSIDLKDDGTYAFIETLAPNQANYVEFKEPYFQHHVSEYDEKSVRFMPIYENTSGKKIVGLKFKVEFRNAFGEEIASFDGDSDESIAPGQTSTASIFYVFKDNQFIAGQMYDKLLPMVTNMTGSRVVTAQMIAFEDGEIVNLSTD